MAFGKRLLDRLGDVEPQSPIAGLPVVPHLGDTFSGEVGFGEDLTLADDPEADLVDEAMWGGRSTALSVFGDDFGVEQSSILALVKSGNEGLNAMMATFGNASAAWAQKDPSGFADFLNDLTALQVRWANAKRALGGGGGIASAIVSAGTAGLYSGAAGQTIYDGLYRALHQGGQGSPIHKGDFLDMSERLKKVTSFDWKPVVDTSGAMATLNSMLPRSVPGVGGIIPDLPDWLKNGVPKLPDPTGDLLKWWREHERMLVIGMAIIGGLMFAGAVVGLFKAAPIGAKFVAAKYLPIAAA